MKRKTRQRLGFQNFRVPRTNGVLGFCIESWRWGEKCETFFFFLFGKVGEGGLLRFFGYSDVEAELDE
ncbi:unnamed protein product, partial [Vitis vinifera]|uniref:Uncharacterized protein n=1 Tax=Vitis vinifera TaxID=29760 RepID=D7TXE3_VITVI